MLVHRGYTLIELCVSLAILSVLVAFAVPPFESLMARSKATASINWILGAVRMTRLSAINHQALVTLCPTSDKTGCGGNWNDTLMIFVDHNADLELNDSDFMVKTLTFPDQDASLKWRSFRNAQYLQMTPEGYTNYQNGNFTYCPADSNRRFARRLVINMQGRARLARDRDGDGIVEDTRNRPVAC